MEASLQPPTNLCRGRHWTRSQEGWRLGCQQPMHSSKGAFCSDVMLQGAPLLGRPELNRTRSRANFSPVFCTFPLWLVTLSYRGTSMVTTEALGAKLSGLAYCI